MSSTIFFPDLEIFRQLLVVLLSVGCLWFLVSMPALDASVDDHDGRSKAGLQLSLCVFLVRLRGKNDFITVSRHFLFEKSHLPRPVNHVKHAGFWWLGICVKPDLDRDCN